MANRSIGTNITNPQECLGHPIQGPYQGSMAFLAWCIQGDSHWIIPWMPGGRQQVLEADPDQVR